MTDHIDVLDEKGEMTGESLPSKEVHARGLFHVGAHVWILNSKGELLLQKRTKNKCAYPEHWTMSSGGHVDSGEKSAEAARRETLEEIGLDIPISEFKLICRIRQPKVIHREDYIDNEFDDVYLVRMDLDVSALSLAPDEVSEVRWLSIEDFKKWVKGEGEPLSPHIEEYTQLLAYLSSL